MNGHLRKRGDKWYYSFELAKVEGKRKRIERVGGRTKKEAAAAMAAAMEEYRRAGQLFDEAVMSVADYMEYWFENYVKVNLKYNTQQYYRGIIDNHVKPAIGKYQLSSIKPAALQQFINDKHLAGFSRSSLKGFIGLLSKSFRMAVHPYQFIKQDPTRFVELPRMEHVPYDAPTELKIITTSDFRRLIERFPRGSSFFVALEIAFHTGLRAGEVCGLTWDCVDPQEKTITVEKIMIMKEHGHWELGSPKTKSSYRTIAISDHLAGVLRQAQKDQKENMLRYGPHYTHSQHVCTKENGEPVTTNSLKYLSRVANYELGITFNFHSLRHTHASMLLSSGASIKAVQERLGHANATTTMNTYAHVTEDMEKATRSLLEDLAARVE